MPDDVANNPSENQAFNRFEPNEAIKGLVKAAERIEESEKQSSAEAPVSGSAGMILDAAQSLRKMSADTENS